jgi:hypothetical protein
MSGCGSSEVMGHGKYAVCGKPYYGEVWQCSGCARKDNARLRASVASLELQRECLRARVAELERREFAVGRNSRTGEE